MKWKCMGVFLLMFFVQLIGSTSPARATSSYDQAIELVDGVRLECLNTSTGGLTGETIDLSSSWLAIVNGDAQEIQGKNIYTYSVDGSAQPGVVRMILQQRINDNKGYGLSQLSVASSSSTPFDYMIDVFIGNSSTTTQYFTSDFYASPAVLASPFGYKVSIYCNQSNVVVSMVSVSSAVEVAYSNSPTGRGDLRPWFSKFDIDYPSGYEGVIIPTEPPSAKYVALGDSFSSGEGIPSFEYGTDVGGTNENRCHRSPQAYPRLLQNDSSLDLGPTAFVACSGATTADVLYGGSGIGAWSEGPQVDALSSDTEIVTITIGGNDVGFSDYVYGCALAPCGPSTTFYNAILANIESPSFLDNLETAYETTLFEAPNADVYVMDYPHLVDPTGVDIPSCVPGVDMTGATGIQQALNAVIADAVDNVQGISGDYATRLHFVPTNHIGSPFIGHHLCTDDPGGAYFNGLNVWDKVYTFHPNSDGQQAYYEIMEDYLS